MTTEPAAARQIGPQDAPAINGVTNKPWICSVTLPDGDTDSGKVDLLFKLWFGINPDMSIIGRERLDITIDGGTYSMVADVTGRAYKNAWHTGIYLDHFEITDSNTLPQGRAWSTDGALDLTIEGPVNGLYDLAGQLVHGDTSRSNLICGRP